jgi:hypothetical protein
LPTEIIHDEDAAVSLHLHRAGIESGDGVKLQVQHLNSQLAADLNRWTLAQDPPFINITANIRRLSVND